MKKFLLVTLFLILLSPPAANAQELHLGVEPTVLYLDAIPPAKIEAPLRIRNLSSSTITLTPRLIPFSTNDEGKINLLLDEEENLASIIRDRISIISENTKVENIDLRAGETKDLVLFMNLVEGDPVGDYYFSLVFMSEGNNVEDSSSSSIPGGIATNVMVSIGPKTPPSALIERFKTNGFITEGPVPFELKIKNLGDHLIQPEGTISIKNIFGKEVGKLTIEPHYLLANSSRYLINDIQASRSSELNEESSLTEESNPSAIWPEKFLMGLYTATATIRLEEGGTTLTSTTRFFAFPLQIIFIISGTIFVILGIILRMRLRLRRKID